MTKLSLGVAFASLISSGAFAGTAVFSPIEGVSAGTGQQAIPSAVSNKGDVVVGGYIWNATNGAQHLGAMSLVDISAAGSNILDAAGGVYVDGVYEQFEFAPRALRLAAMSDDASVVVGRYINYGTMFYDEQESKEVIWTSSRGFIAQGKYVMHDVSPDGRYAVGQTEGGTAIYVDIEAEDVTVYDSSVTGCSIGCGSLKFEAISSTGVPVGKYTFDKKLSYRSEPAFWLNGQPVQVGTLSETVKSGSLLAVSEDAGIMVGYAYTNDEDVSLRGDNLEAVIWDSINGLRSLEEVLVDGYGIDLGGWKLTKASAISNDGYIIAGYGLDPQGNYSPWAVSMSAECSAVTW